jgi:hypothetical protein
MGSSVANRVVICFQCRSSACSCVSRWNGAPAGWTLKPEPSQLALAVAWLSGACMAGTALGALLAMLLS